MGLNVGFLKDYVVFFVCGKAISSNVFKNNKLMSIIDKCSSKSSLSTKVVSDNKISEITALV